jgi:glycosyltransferase involved in cell wall biosynthesis
MRIVIHAGLLAPPLRYGGAERFAIWIGRGLRDLGHDVIYLAAPESRIDFAPVIPFDPTRTIDAQLPPGTDIVHLNDPSWPRGTPACMTYHGTSRVPVVHHPNTVFVSADHASRNGGSVFVWHGIDPADYPEPHLDTRRDRLTFLAKAAWRVKNVRGAIRTARRAHLPIDILGGRRVELVMDIRVTLDLNARFHGMVDDACKARCLDVSRGMISPVRWHEPFGIAIVEAMYFGVPVFGTPYGSLPELIPDFAGHLAISAEELAAAITRGGYDPHRIHRYARERFDHRRMARDYVALYGRILAGETLHAGELHAPATRPRRLLPWAS